MVILLYLLLSDCVASQLSAFLRSAFLHPAVLLLSRCVCVIVSFVRGFVSISLRDAPLWAQVKAIWRGPYIRRGRWYKEAARVFKRGPNLCATQQHLKPLLQESSSASNLRGNDTLHPRVHREADKFPRSAGPQRGSSGRARGRVHTALSVILVLSKHWFPQKKPSTQKRTIRI